MIKSISQKRFCFKKQHIMRIGYVGFRLISQSIEANSASFDAFIVAKAQANKLDIVPTYKAPLSNQILCHPFAKSFFLSCLQF